MVNPALPFVGLLGLPLCGSIEHLGLDQAVGHIADLGGNLALGLLNLVQLAPQYLVLLLLKGGLILLRGRLKLQPLGLKTLPDFANLSSKEALQVSFWLTSVS